MRRIPPITRRRKARCVTARVRRRRMVVVLHMPERLGDIVLARVPVTRAIVRPERRPVINRRRRRRSRTREIDPRLHKVAHVQGHGIRARPVGLARIQVATRPVTRQSKNKIPATLSAVLSAARDIVIPPPIQSDPTALIDRRPIELIIKHLRPRPPQRIAHRLQDRYSRRDNSRRRGLTRTRPASIARGHDDINRVPYIRRLHRVRARTRPRNVLARTARRGAIPPLIPIARRTVRPRPVGRGQRLAFHCRTRDRRDARDHRRWLRHDTRRRRRRRRRPASVAGRDHGRDRVPYIPPSAHSST